MMLPVRSALFLLALAVASAAQVADQVIVFGVSNDVLRFDRRLDLLGDLTLPSSGGVGGITRLAIDGQGVAWIPFDASNPTDVVRMKSDGSLLPEVTIGHNPMMLVSSRDGRAFCITRIPLAAPGPAYGLNADGSVQWVNPQGPEMDLLSFPQEELMTSGGQLWIGTTTPQPGKFWARTLLICLNTNDGSVARTFWPPDLTHGPSGFGDEVLPDVVAATDGTMWMHRWGPASPTNFGAMEKTDGLTILQSFTLTTGMNSLTAAKRVDGEGKIYMVSAQDVQFGSLLFRFNPASPSAPEATYTMGGMISGFALGANGDEAYATVAPQSAPLTRRLERVNLVTGRKSSRSMDAWSDSVISYGDPNGFIYANTIDREGDNDGDGIPNGIETAVHSNPFDPLSRPNGPKVFIDFAPGTNALVLTYQDPDGLLDPVGGLDLSTLSVTIGNYGNVFWLLAPFLTALDLSPDGKQATLTYGALPLPANKKWQVDATIADLTGATGCDWQVTPPGDL
ncbi:MAG TPA: hypothetical protein VFX19_04115 [Dehalococcoidia bacterium]|nr:hypothetical protein [Dehalococcoidia bacterium]